MYTESLSSFCHLLAILRTPSLDLYWSCTHQPFIAHQPWRSFFLLQPSQDSSDQHAHSFAVSYFLITSYSILIASLCTPSSHHSRFLSASISILPPLLFILHHCPLLFSLKCLPLSHIPTAVLYSSFLLSLPFFSSRSHHTYDALKQTISKCQYSHARFPPTPLQSLPISLLESSCSLPEYTISCETAMALPTVRVACV